MTLSTQLSTLLAMTATGLSMAWIFDLYTWGRAQIRVHKIISFVFDLVYWVLFAFTVLAVLYYVNQGKIRISILFAILLGGILYFQLLSRPFLRIWNSIIAVIVRIVRFIYQLLLMLIYRPIVWVLTTLLGIAIGIGAGLWKLLRSILYWGSRPFIAISHNISRWVLAQFQKVGKMIVQLLKKKPHDE